jgi:hypothetical protein
MIGMPIPRRSSTFELRRPDSQRIGGLLLHVLKPRGCKARADDLCLTRRRASPRVTTLDFEKVLAIERATVERG